MQFVLELEKLFHLAFEEFGNGNAGPAGDDFGDVFFVHLFFQEASGAVFAGDVILFGVQFALQIGEGAVFEFGGFVEIISAFGLSDFNFDLFDLFAQSTDALDAFFLVLPLGLQSGRLSFKFGEFFFDAARDVLSKRYRFPF